MYSTKNKMAHLWREASVGPLHQSLGAGEGQRTPLGVGVERVIPLGVDPGVAPFLVEAGMHLRNKGPTTMNSNTQAHRVC